MAPSNPRKRKVEGSTSTKRPYPHKKAARHRSTGQIAYDSGSGSDTPIGVNGSEHDGSAAKPRGGMRDQDTRASQPVSRVDEALSSSTDDEDQEHPLGQESADSTSDSGAESDTSSNARVKKRKRNDPDAFASSMSKILSSKLTTAKRADPLLARSKSAATASHELSEARLEVKARHKLREQKKAELDRGRVKDILSVASADSSGTIGDSLELERRLRRTAQKGVVKLFNAVRAAQVQAEEAAKEARKGGLIGVGRREEKVTEMSKQGFLDLIAGGGTKPTMSKLGD